MATGKHSSSEITVTIDATQGGSGQAITAYLTSGVEAGLNALMEKVTAYGDTSEKNFPVGLTSVDDITLHGWFDDTATTGPHVIFGSSGPDTSLTAGSRTVVIVFGNSKTFTCEMYCASYKVMGKVAGLTEFDAKLVQAGAGAWT